MYRLLPKGRRREKKGEEGSRGEKKGEGGRRWEKKGEGGIKESPDVESHTSKYRGDLG